MTQESIEKDVRIATLMQGEDMGKGKVRINGVHILVFVKGLPVMVIDAPRDQVAEAGAPVSVRDGLVRVNLGKANKHVVSYWMAPIGEDGKANVIIQQKKWNKAGTKVLMDCSKGMFAKTRPLLKADGEHVWDTVLDALQCVIEALRKEPVHNCECGKCAAPAHP